MYRLSVLCFMLVTLSCPMRCKPKQTATYFFAGSIFSLFLIARFSDNPFLCSRTIHLTMEQPVFVAQYTFLAIPETIEEERRILGKVALRCEYVIRFEDDGKFYFLLETHSNYETQFARYGWYISTKDSLSVWACTRAGIWQVSCIT